jgi:hypothetical protein
VLNVLSILIDKENLEYEQISVITAINCCWDNRLAELVLAKLKDNKLKPKCMGSLLSTLLAHDSVEAHSFAESIILSPPSTDSERARRIVAAQTMLMDAQDAGWPTVWLALQQDIELGKEVIHGIQHDYTSIGLRLNEEQLTDLYIWLYRNFPAPAPSSGGAHWVGPLEEIDMWRNSIINLLKQRGTYRACDAIRKLQSELPELEWLKWVLADVQDETRRITWTPSRPDEILKLTDNPELRLVQNGDQLLDVIIESLRRLDMQLQAETPLAPYLWDRDGKADARPKDENSLSNYVKIHLDKDVKTRGIICNREVQIHRGERTDIHVDAIVPASFGNAYDIVSVIIEVKGCWNHDIHESMQGQLVDRYLKDNLCQHGIL